MSPKNIAKRTKAVAVADALNQIEGVPVSEEARNLSLKWAKGEISGATMKQMLIAKHSH